MRIKGGSKMTIPGFTAGASLYKTSGQYWMAAFNTSTGQVLPQQDSFGDCVRFGGACAAECNNRGNPAGCPEACSISFLGCVEDLGDGDGGIGSGERRVIERSGCFPDRTSSTGWRLRECFTMPGASGLATQCHWSDECPAPGCGPCKCTTPPGGTLTCRQQCFRYSQMTGEALTYTRSPCKGCGPCVGDPDNPGGPHVQECYEPGSGYYFLPCCYDPTTRSWSNLACRLGGTGTGGAF